VGLLHRIRRVYFFGYGAEREADAIHAITGRKPRVVGPAILKDYELRVQSLEEAHDRLRPIFKNAWGESFRSYVVVPEAGGTVKGTLYKVSLHDRHLIDEWELTELGWCEKIFIRVTLESSLKVYDAETQRLGAGQKATIVANGTDYSPWLQSKKKFVQIATQVRQAGAK
jgi:hypothetical protein